MVPDWAHAHGRPTHHCLLKRHPDDFHVTEQFAFERCGEGEFLYLDVEKIGINTVDAASHLSSALGLHPRQISWSGLKDKQAVTRQWFSLHLPGVPDPDLRLINSSAMTVLSAVRHNRKLRRGTHQSNQFRIRLRSVSGDHEILNDRLRSIRHFGVPNYFGDQRFGKSGQNITGVIRAYSSGRMPRNRHLKGIYHSTARAYLFNDCLQARVIDDCWNRAVSGELFILDGTQSWFGPEQETEAIRERLKSADIHPSCALWGRGLLESTNQSREYDQRARSMEHLTTGLEAAGLRQERRATRLIPRAFEFDWSGDDLVLSFDLQKGQYATALIRELAQTAMPIE